VKKFLANLFYFVGAIAYTYVFQWILTLWIGGVRFTAAGRPPGDIGLGSKLMYSIGFPLFHFVVLTIVFFLYRFILNQLKIELKKMIPITINITITLYLICHITFVVFDLFMYGTYNI
jgi:hypothetical protein